MALTETQKSFYADLERTFNSPGWAHLMKGWTQELEALPQIAFFNVKTMEELEAFRVRHTLLSQLTGLPDDIKADKEALEQEHAEEDV